jgi:hypothetical protein
MTAARLSFAIFVSAALFCPRSACADAIDGDWCQPDGRQMAIRGPSIVTVGGNGIRGDYTRHGFSYVIPPSEPGAGKTVQMILLNEDTVQLMWPEGAVKPPLKALEIWHRCRSNPTS